MLISGVAVFAMLQLPGWLNDRLMFLLPRFEDSWRASLIMVFSYAMGAAVILAATFALHLLLRAYWIALVGMHSVYPDGIRWERLRLESNPYWRILTKCGGRMCKQNRRRNSGKAKDICRARPAWL